MSGELIKCLIDFEEAIDELDGELYSSYGAARVEVSLDACAVALKRLAQAHGVLESSKDHADPFWKVLRRLPERYREDESDIRGAERRLRKLVAELCYDGGLEDDELEEAEDARSTLHDALTRLWQVFADDIQARMEQEP